MDYVDIDRVAGDADADLVALRLDIHRHPEPSGAEARTAALAAARLRAAGLDVATGVGGHGVVGVLDGGAPGPTVAYRADLDAVTGDGGVAHGCGHDVHTAVGIGVAEVLACLRHRLAGRVVFLFQPAEEDLTGAAAMIAGGVLRSYPPAEIFALHCAPLPVGTFAVMPGTGQPGLDRFRAEVADPEAAERLAAQVRALSTVALPASDEEFGRLAAALFTPDGPLARFVYAGADARADGVYGWVRAWPDDRYEALRAEVRRLAGAVGAVPDYPAPPFPAMVCAPEQSRAMGAHLAGLPCVEEVAVMRAAFPFNGEDFALFLREVPGAMAYLGVGPAGQPHAPDFAADDRAVGIAVRAMSSLLAQRVDALRG